MQIPFTGYAEDCTVTGEIDLVGDRLSDFLASTTEFEIGSPAFQAIDDGHAVRLPTCSIAHGDLCLVLATGPRGSEERRVWTRQHPVRARVGPYTVLGNLHAPPTIDPYRSAERRPIVAVTASVLEYPQGGELAHVEADAILIFTDKIEALEPVTGEEIAQAKRLDLGALTSSPALGLAPID